MSLLILSHFVSVLSHYITYDTHSFLIPYFSSYVFLYCLLALHCMIINICNQMKKWLDYLMTWPINRWDSNNKKDEPIFFYESVFLTLASRALLSGGKYIDPLIFVHYKSLSLDASYKTPFWINATVFDSSLRKGWRYTPTIINNNNSHASKCSSATVLILFSQSVSISIFLWTPFLLFFSRLFYVLTWFFCLLSLEELNHLRQLQSCFWICFSCNLFDVVNTGYRE